MYDTEVFGAPLTQGYDKDVFQETKPTVAQPETKPPKQEDSVLRQLGLTARAGIKGIAALPAMAADAVTGVSNSLLGTKFKQQMPELDALLSRMGLPQAGSSTERIIQDMTSAMAGAGGTAKAAENAANPLADLFAKNLPTQILSAGTSAGAAGATRESGGGIPAQIAAGIVGGMVPTAAQTVAKPFAKYGGELLDLIRQSGPENIVNRYTSKIVGEKNLPELIDQAFNARELVPGAKPTLAEVVSGTPSGSPLVAQQRITSQTPGGASAQFGQRKSEQEAAIQAAISERGAVTAPMREQALAGANKAGPLKPFGVQTEPIITRIDELASVPGDRASEVVKKTLNSIRDKISENANQFGIVDARDLYTIRKEIGNVIQMHSKENSSWDKKMTSGLERNIQKSIDDAIETAGGIGWKNYLQEFSKRSGAIEAEQARQQAAYAPAQKTNLQGGINITNEQQAHLPNLLSRPAMLANYAMRMMGAGVEKKVDAVNALRELNPEEFAKAFSKLSPEEKFSIFARDSGLAGTLGTMQLLGSK